MNSKLYISLLCGLCFFAACSEEVLEKEPIDFLNPETFYSSAENLETGLYGVYDALQQDQAFGDISQLAGISDNGTFAKFPQELIDFSKGRLNTAVTEVIASYYSAPYQIIQRANLLLDNINIEGPIAIEERLTIEAEARALRAIAYYRLVYLFGDVPLVTTTLNRDEILSLTQDPKSEIIDFILEELTFAANQLAVMPFNGERGRLTKQAALGFRARVLVYEARLGNLPWAEALRAAQEAVDNALVGGAELFTVGDGTNGKANYEELFLFANEGNTETIFAVQGIQTDPLRDYWGGYAVQGGVLSLSVMDDLVNDFYGTDGLPITDSNSNFDPENPYENRDPRLAVSINFPGSLFSNTLALEVFEGRVTQSVLETDFAQRKLTTLDGITPNRGVIDVMVIRFAELLLLLAEAENEVNGPTAAAYDAVNQVRRRVGMPEVSPGLTQDAFREEVIHERRIEFCFEGLRWFDLVTLGIADERINGLNTLERAYIPGTQERFPIPEGEIDLNPSLNQNPGY